VTDAERVAELLARCARTEHLLRRERERIAVLYDVLEERYLQDFRWEDQSHLPDGTGDEAARAQACVAKAACQRAADAGRVTWRHVLAEEVAEALAEAEPAKLRRELVQVAAVAAAWVEALDRRSRGVAAVVARGDAGGAADAADEGGAPMTASASPAEGRKRPPATLTHDEGAVARCSFCGRYTLDPAALGPAARQPDCECGRRDGWCGSFVPPGDDAQWSRKAPPRVVAVPDTLEALAARIARAEPGAADDLAAALTGLRTDVGVLDLRVRARLERIEAYVAALAKARDVKP